jgi:anti-anti-sigma regulatory factor
MAEIDRSGHKFIIRGTLTWKEADLFLKKAVPLIRNYSQPTILFELDGLKEFDTAGAGALYRCRELLEKLNIEVQYSGGASELLNTLEMIAHAGKGGKLRRIVKKLVSWVGLVTT